MFYLEQRVLLKTIHTANTYFSFFFYLLMLEKNRYFHSLNTILLNFFQMNKCKQAAMIPEICVSDVPFCVHCKLNALSTEDGHVIEMFVLSTFCTISLFCLF